MLQVQQALIQIWNAHYWIDATLRHSMFNSDLFSPDDPDKHNV